MKKKIGWKVTLTALVVALALATTLPGATAQAKSKVAMNKVKVTVCTGKSYTLKMTGISKKVKWSTSDKNVVSITKKSGKKAEKVTIKGNKKGTATVTAKVGKKKYKATVKVAGHKYGKVTYKWNKDYSKCTASKKCSRCGKTLKQTVKASSKTTTKATCTEKGAKKYTAKFTKYGFGTKNKSVSIKMKSHSVDSNKKISYKWNGDYSKCTATFYCKAGGEKVTETVKSTKKTTPATTTAEGKEVYTATFKTKGLKKQTYTHKLDTLCYLDKTNVTLKAGSPVTINLKNKNGCQYDVDQIEFDGEPDAGETYVWSDKSMERKRNITCKWGDGSITLSTIKPVPNRTYTVRLTTLGQTLECKVTTVFTPGEYCFGEVNHCYETYHAYGKYKGTYAPKGSPDYYMDCNTRADYDAAYNFYNHQVRRDGTECDLNQKAQEIERECGERANYKSQAEIDWNEMAYEDRILYDDDLWTYIKTVYGDVYWKYYQVKVFPDYIESVDGTKEYLTSNAQVKQIVIAWANEYNEGQMPSWYYYTAFSDWAEWSGRDINAGKFEDWAKLPDNFRD